MNKRPPSIAVISWLFILVGGIDFFYHLSAFPGLRPPGLLPAGICAVRLIPLIAGAFMLAGLPWARWLLVWWMAYYLVLSAFHSATEPAMHLLVFGVVAFFLFRPAASLYFRSGRGRFQPILDREGMPFGAGRARDGLTAGPLVTGEPSAALRVQPEKPARPSRDF